MTFEIRLKKASKNRIRVAVRVDGRLQVGTAVLRAASGPSVRFVEPEMNHLIATSGRLGRTLVTLIADAFRGIEFTEPVVITDVSSPRPRQLAAS